jgi:hypothetical protein
MLRATLCSVLAMFIFVGGILAAEATIVKYDKEAGKMTLKVGNREQMVDLKTIKVLEASGKEVAFDKLKDLKALREGEKIEVTEKDGKITEIKLTEKKPQ